MGTYCGKWNKLWMDLNKLKAMKWSSITRQKCRNSANFLFKKRNKSPTCLKNNKWWNLMCVKLNQNSAEIFSHFQSWGKNDSFVKAGKFWRKMPENFFTRKIHFIFLGAGTQQLIISSWKWFASLNFTSGRICFDDCPFSTKQEREFFKQK